ncbi:MAG: DUF4440 domain-containing protein [Acidimicrobiia bacterium]|nr:DUF4440 domain-containing protein [Acidimicrobiia bacterium]
MQRTLLVISIAAFALLATGCAPAPPPAAPKPDTAAMVKAADDLDKAFLDAFNKGDAAAITALYWNSPDVISFPPDGMQLKGVAAIQEAFTKSFGEMKGAKLEFSDSRNVAVGEVVLGSGLFKITIPGPGGKPMEMAGRFSDVKAERDGKWVYIMDHGSVPLPPPPAAK